MKSLTECLEIILTIIRCVIGSLLSHGKLYYYWFIWTIEVEQWCYDMCHSLSWDVTLRIGGDTIVTWIVTCLRIREYGLHSPGDVGYHSHLHWNTLITSDVNRINRIVLFLCRNLTNFLIELWNAFLYECSSYIIPFTKREVQM